MTPKKNLRQQMDGYQSPRSRLTYNIPDADALAERERARAGRKRRLAKHIARTLKQGQAVKSRTKSAASPPALSPASPPALSPASKARGTKKGVFSGLRKRMAKGPLGRLRIRTTSGKKGALRRSASHEDERARTKHSEPEPESQDKKSKSPSPKDNVTPREPFSEPLRRGGSRRTRRTRRRRVRFASRRRRR